MLVWGIFMVLVQMWEQDEEGTSEEDPGVLEEGVSLGMALTGTEDELEVAVGGLGLVTGQDEEDAAAEGLQTATRMSASEPVMTTTEEEVMQVAMTVIWAMRSRNLLSMIY